MKWRLQGWLRRRNEPHAADPDEEARSYAAAASHVGKVRAGNEDAYLCAPERGLFLVADGMGGHVAGEQASAAVIRAVNAFLTPERLAELPPGDCDAAGEMLCAALTDADAALRTVTTAQPELQGMGSTAVIAVLRDSALHVANVGDSRAYLVRAGQAKLLSRDHSVAALLAERGEISPEEARKHPLRNQLRECLGGHRPPRPDYVCAPLWPGDRVVLCSDGLWDMVPDQQTAAMVAEGADPLEVARALVAAANASGGRDNITVIVLFPELGRPGES